MSADPFASLLAARAEHPSDLTLDRWHAKELLAAESRAVESHAGSCASCAARMAERTQGFGAVAVPAGQPAIDERRLLAGIRRGLDERPARRPLLSRWLAIGAGSLAAAATLLIVVNRPQNPEGPVLREKGGLSLHVFREANGRAEEAVSGDRFASGDHLRFVADLPRDGEVRVLGVEAGGALYTAWPVEPGSATALSRGHAELPGAVKLDQSQGRETLYLVECANAADVSDCHHGGAGEKSLRCPASCELSPFVLEKH